MAKQRKTLGKLKPQHTFFLNPYSNARFTRCPKCDSKTKIRKFPFAIHIDPRVMMTLNMSGPYCPSCDLIILHQDRVEELLTATFVQRDPSIIGNNYLIVGVVEQSYWKKASTQGGSYQELFDNLHDFKRVVKFEPQRWVWMPKEEMSVRRGDEQGDEGR
ncbi:MAG: hypothetical protein JNL42_03135 [Anaerolineae bacterium]|nr:hypothetical protein [Anaerolineae bacterium]